MTRSSNAERVTVTKLSLMLRKCREHAGVSMGELGRRAGVTTAYVSRIENGDRAPSIDVLFRLVEACGGELKFEVTFKGSIPK